MRHWLFILIGVVFEVIWVMGLKHATHLGEWIITVASIFISFFCFMRPMKVLPVGTVYAVYVGLGTAATVIAEMVFFNEPVQPLKIVLIAILVASVMGLKFVTHESDQQRSAH